MPKLFLFLALLNAFFYVKINAQSAENDTELELLQIVFRHGDRTPVTVYPNDPYNVSYWDKYGGLGQLTQTGMRQHYEFGEYIRARYADFLSAQYNKDRVYVRSTDYDRTQMSVQSLLASLYKPVDYQIWNQNVSWQPIPVHTSDSEKIFANPDKCDRYNQLKFEFKDLDEYKQLTAKYQDVIDAVNRESGYSNMNLIDIWMICDDVFVQKSHNLTLPKWVQDNLDKLMELRDVGFYIDFRTTEMGKLASGGVLNEVKKNILGKKNNPHSKNELFLFSSHDTYVAGLVRLLNLTQEIRQPPYASAVLFELRKSTKTQQRFVKVLMKNNTADEQIQLCPMTVYGCDAELCPLDRFLDLVQDKVVTDFSSLCKLSQKEPSLENLTIILSFGFVSLIGLIIGLFSCKIFLFRKDSGYRQLSENV